MMAKDPKDRKRFLDENEAVLRQDFQKAKTTLTPEERELGERLLADGAWMASNNDPWEESKRVSNVADALGAMTHATEGKKERERERERFELRFFKVMHCGVQPCLEKVNQLKPPETKGEVKKGPGPTPSQQFVDRQMEARKQYEMLHKKGFSFRPPPFGNKR